MRRVNAGMKALNKRRVDRSTRTVPFVRALTPIDPSIESPVKERWRGVSVESKPRPVPAWSPRRTHDCASARCSTGTPSHELRDRGPRSFRSGTLCLSARGFSPGGAIEFACIRARARSVDPTSEASPSHRSSLARANPRTHRKCPFARAPTCVQNPSRARGRRVTRATR